MACLALPFPLSLQTKDFSVEVSSPSSCEDGISSCEFSDLPWEAVGPSDRLEGPPWEAVGPFGASAGQLCRVPAATVVTLALTTFSGLSNPACCQSHLRDQ